MLKRLALAGITFLSLYTFASAIDIGPNAPPAVAGSSLTLAGPSGALQTNNGSGNLGSLTLGAGVAAAAVNAADTAGGLALAVSKRVTSDQSRIPMILPSSGSIANNGALTLTTALDQAYPAAYFYEPAGAIAAGSVAGFYYGTMSSTTAVTLFNNLYVSGSPVIPASPTAFVTTGPGGYTQTTGTLLTAHLFVISGGILGANDEISVHGLASYNNSAGVKTVALTYGGSFTYGSIAPTTTATTAFQGGFANAGIVTRQSQTGLSALTVGTATGAAINGSINSAINQNLAVTLRIATATDYVILQNYSAERIVAAAN